MGTGTSRNARRTLSNEESSQAKNCSFSREVISLQLSISISGLLDRQPSRDNLALTPITPASMRICIASWSAISTQTLSINNQAFSGASMFANQFFVELAEIDPDGSIIALLRSKNNVRKCFYERVLVSKMMKFILSLEDDKFCFKAKLRTVGRSHARIGVGASAITIFNEAILRTISARLDTAYLIRHDVIHCWAMLLDFALTEMTVEKVQFLRCDSGDIIGGKSNIDMTRNFSLLSDDFEGN